MMKSIFKIFNKMRKLVIIIYYYALKQFFLLKMTIYFYKDFKKNNKAKY